MIDIETFAAKIGDLDKKSSSKIIPFFGYYLTKIEGHDSFQARDIEVCFNFLKIPPYSNISAYLSKSIKKKTFVKNNQGGYNLSLAETKRIDEIINAPREVTPSKNFFPLELFDGTRDYLKKTAKQ